MLIRLDEVSVLHDGRAVVDRVSLSVGRGRVHAIVGPSGSGKTTLLNLLDGRCAPDQGRRSVIESYGMASWITQTSVVLGRRTALDNVALGALNGSRTWSIARRSALEVMETMGIGEVAKVEAGRLSGGEQQRVAVARAVVGGAAVLIGDEPTASLDGDSRDRLVEAFRRAARAGVCVVLATHDARVALESDVVVELGRASEVVYSAGSGSAE